MITEKRARKICESVFQAVPRGEVEVLLQDETSSLTRFAENQIHQNVSQSSMEVSVRVQLGKRVGRASTNRLDEDSLGRCAERALTFARLQPEDPSLLSMPGPQTYRKVSAFAKGTAQLSPEERADAVAGAVRLCKSKKLKAAGKYESGSSVLALANSKGLFATHRATESCFDITAMAGDSAGWASAANKDMRCYEPKVLTERAVGKALRSRKPVAVPPGPYTVVLEPAAVTDFLMFMALYGFGGLAYLEGRSFTSGKMGRKILGENVTIVDDAYAEGTNGIPFDFEGMPRQRVPLIDRGVVAGVVHDRQTARRAGTKTTGHALPQPNSYGPIPLNPCFGPGELSLEEMISDTKRGLLVTHFHYTNIIDPMRMILTGMTRDGTFLIENGKIRRPVQNMRFTQSVIEALNSVRAISRDRESAPAFWGSTMLVPAMQIDGFTFSSGTEF